VSFQRGDEVAALVDLGGLLRGKVPAGTPGVVDETEISASAEVLYTVTFTIDQEDLLMPHRATLTQLTRDQLTRPRPGSPDPA
jgi:hypothetical protein